MSWFEYMEQKRKLLIGGVVFICLAMLMLTIRRYNVSLDSFWHLRMGQDWLESGLSLWQDHYSFTFNGEDIVGPPYLFEVLIGWLVTQLGFELGFEVFKLGAFILVFSLVILFLRKLRAPVVVYCLVLPLLILLIQLRAIVRPELLSYSFIVIAIMLYYRARHEMSAANILPMLALMLLWCNYHSSIFGYIIFFGYFIDLALQQIHDRASTRTWLQWLGWGLAITAVGFLNPGYNHPLLGFLSFSPEWKHLIQEYQSAILYREVAAVYSLIAVSLVTLVLLLRMRQFGLLFVCVLLIVFSIDMVRLVTPSGIVVLCIFAWIVSEIDLGKKLRRIPLGWNRTIGGSVLVVFFLALASSVTLARNFMTENRTSGLMFPKDIVDYMVDQGISGRIYNEYGIGGYLIYRLSPDSQVYIDGRTGILYPLEHFYRQMDAERSPELLRAEIEQYNIDLAVVRNDQRYYSLMSNTGVFGLDYIGVNFLLFKKEQPNFPVLGTLLAQPACWDENMSSALEDEQANAITIQSSNSWLLLYINFVMAYTRADDKITFLRNLDHNSQWTEPKLRFAGHQALNLGLNSIAHEFFAGIQEKEFGDYLGGAMAKARLGEWKISEIILDMGTRRSWSEDLSEISILHGLLVQISQNHELELIDEAYINRLAEKVTARDGSSSSSVPNPRSFCPKI